MMPLMGPGAYRRELRDLLKRYKKNTEKMGYLFPGSIKMYDKIALLEADVEYNAKRWDQEGDNPWFIERSIEDLDNELFESNQK